jgi:hypothetical protein
MFCPALLPERVNHNGAFPVVSLTLPHRLISAAPPAQKTVKSRGLILVA